MGVVREFHRPSGRQAALYEGTIKCVGRIFHEQWHGLVRKVTEAAIDIELWKEGHRIADFRFKPGPLVRELGLDRLDAFAKMKGDDLREEQMAIADLNIEFEKAKPFAYEETKGTLTDKLAPSDFQLRREKLEPLTKVKCALCGKLVKPELMDKHLANVCPENTISCELCNAEFKRKEKA